MTASTRYAGLQPVLVRTAGAAGAKLSGGLLNLVMAATAANVLSIEEYGRFAFALSVGLFMSVVAQRGVPMVVLRFQSLLRAEGNTADEARLLRWSAQALGTAALGVTSGIVAAAALGSALDLPIDAAGLALGGLLAVSHAMSEWISASLRALDRMVWALVPRDVGWRLATILALLIAAAAAPSAELAIGLSTAALTAIVAAQTMLVAKITGAAPRGRADCRDDGWHAAANGMWLLSIAMAVNHVGEPMLVGIALSAEATALYFAAFTLSGMANLGHMSVALAVGPQIASAHHQAERARLRRIMGLAAGLSTLGGAAILLIAIFMGDWLLRLFGPSFEAAHGAFAILAAGHAVQGLSGQSLSYLQLTGRERKAARIVIVSSGLFIVVFAALAPWLGIVGAAAASAGSKALRSVWAWVVVLREDGMDASLIMRPLRLDEAPRPS